MKQLNAGWLKDFLRRNCCRICSQGQGKTIDNDLPRLNLASRTTGNERIEENIAK